MQAGETLDGQFIFLGIQRGIPGRLPDTETWQDMVYDFSYQMPVGLEKSDALERLLKKRQAKLRAEK